MRCALLPAVLVLGLLGCQPKQQPTDTENSKPPSFPTAEEAANNAKSDLLSVLRTQRNINLGVNEAALEKSQPGTPIKHYQITFDELLSADAAASFSNLAHNEVATVVPFVADNELVTIAGVGKNDTGWSVAFLVDKTVSDDLNVLRRATQSSLQDEITIYDLPHSSVKVYGITKSNGTSEMSRPLFYTNYSGFDIHEGVPAERLLPLLKRDAAEFQRKYGDAINNQTVVH